MDHRMWLNDKRTVSVTVWDNGEVTFAQRGQRADTWGPPVTLTNSSATDFNGQCRWWESDDANITIGIWDNGNITYALTDGDVGTLKEVN